MVSFIWHKRMTAVTKGLSPELAGAHLMGYIWLGGGQVLGAENLGMWSPVLSLYPHLHLCGVPQVAGASAAGPASPLLNL